MSKNSNTPQIWDKLLSNNKYLYDFGESTKIRILVAYGWWKNQKKIINLGSGQGFLEKKFLKYIQSRMVEWTSVDISTEGLQRIKKMSNQIVCINADVRNLRVINNKFDLVYCMEVLEHLTKVDVSKAYREILRVSSENSKFVFSVPIYEPIALVSHPVGHNRKYTPRLFKDELIENGFVIVDEIPVYAFNSLYWIKSTFSKFFGLRRPSVMMFLCKKS